MDGSNPRMPTFANFWQPFVETRIATHVDKYGGFQDPEIFRHSDGPFGTCRGADDSVTSVLKYPTSGRTVRSTLSLKQFDSES
jgi:hypothetical protein